MRTIHRAAIGLGMLVIPASAGGAQEIFGNDFESRNTLAWTSEVPPLEAPTVFRANAIQLKDPHVFGDVGICADLTSSFNSTLAAQVGSDGDGDGFLDLSLLHAFRPLEVAGVGLRFDTGYGDCVSSTSCSWKLEPVPVTGDYSTEATMVCLEPIAGTTRPSYGTIATPAGPCFVSELGDLVLPLFGVDMTFRGTKVAAQFTGDPPTALGTGLLMGFLRMSDADSIVVPASVPIFGGLPLSSAIRGGSGNCATGSDADTGPDSESGWWFYFGFADGEVTTFTGR